MLSSFPVVAATVVASAFAIQILFDPAAPTLLAPLGNAAATVCFLAARPRRWPWLLLAAILPLAVFGAASGQVAAAGRAGCSLIEVVICAGLTQSLIGRRPDFGKRRRLLTLSLAAGAGAWIAACIGLATGARGSAPIASFLLDHAAADQLAIIALVPPLSMLITGGRRKLADLFRSPAGVVTFASLPIVAGWLFAERPDLFGVLALPLLLAVSWRHELTGAAVAAVMTIAVTIGLSALGKGGEMLDLGSSIHPALGLYLFLAIGTVMLLGAGAMARRRRRLFAALSNSRKEILVAKAAAQGAVRRADMTSRLAGLGCWRIDAATREMTWSSALPAILGLPSDAQPSLVKVLAACGVEDRNWLEAQIMGALDTGESYDFHRRYVRADGAVRKLVGRAACEFDEAGQVIGIVGAVMDVTDLSRAEMAVLEGETRWRAVTDSAIDLILRMDLEGRITYASPSAQHILGRNPDDLVGTVKLDSVLVADRARVRAAFERLVVNKGLGPSEPITYRVKHSGGRQVWHEANLTLVLDQAGEPVEIIAFIRDISRTKASADMLAAALAEAEQAAAAKSAFLANMSHELRTPLNSVIGFTSALSRDPALTKPQRRQLSLIESAGRSLLAVVNDVLDFSKLEAGRLELQQIDFRPAQMVEDAVALVRHHALDKGLRLTCRLTSGSHLVVLGDPDRLRQIVLNLLSNAIKFTEAGRISVDIECCEIGDRVALTIKVADTGVGIDPVQVERLFERFEQSDSSMSRRFGGTGLGLAISRSLIAQMGGDILVSSLPGKGSVFTVLLSLPAGAPQDVDPTAALDVGPELGLTDLKLLIAEDVDVNQELIRLLLERFCSRIDCVEDGQAALDMAAAPGADYDLVLMDVQMPVMDGLEASRLIRSLGGAWERIPILALTANVLPDQIARCRAAGMQDHVSKPFDSNVLMSAVAKWARIARAGAIPPAPMSPEHQTSSPRTSGVDFDKLGRLETQIGAAALETLLRAMAAQLRSISESQGLERAEIRTRAHRVLGAAGLLGLDDVARACRSLEKACAGDGTLTGTRKTAMHACRVADEQIDQMLSRGAPFSPPTDASAQDACGQRAAVH